MFTRFSPCREGRRKCRWSFASNLVLVILIHLSHGCHVIAQSGCSSKCKSAEDGSMSTSSPIHSRRTWTCFGNPSIHLFMVPVQGHGSLLRLNWIHPFGLVRNVWKLEIWSIRADRHSWKLWADILRVWEASSHSVALLDRGQASKVWSWTKDGPV